MQFKLANIVFDTSDFLAGHEDLLYRTEGVPGAARATYLPSEGALEFAGKLDLLTYFNALPLQKWLQYTSLNNVSLHLELVGSDCDVVIARANDQAFVQAETLANMYASQEWQSFDVPVSLDSSVLCGAQLVSAGSTKVRNAYFYTEVKESRIRPVRLALATTTFNNEDYIKPNIELVKTQILGSNEPIARAFHMFVVDNGQTLDAAALASEGVSVVANPNVGGAGGFARGMLEALGEGTSQVGREAFTHVLLMDDDVHVFPESFIRTFNLLSLVNTAYQNACVQGAMLNLQEPNLQFEDVSYAKRSGGYERYKTTADISTLENMVSNETTSVEGAQSYGAWWYSCIPVSAIREHGLPLPLFIRIDDVEYGMRCKPVYMCMGGICVWHSQFVGRFRASVDGYQYARNMLIAMACDGFADERVFMLKYWRNFHIYLRFMAYETAELWLDALEDYLKGPDWLAAADGAQIMRDNAAKNEKLVPVEELDPAIMAQIEVNHIWLGHEELQRSALAKAAKSLPYDKHYLPDVLLKDEPAFVDYSGSLSPWQETARRKVLVALDATAEHGHIRIMDRERHGQLMKRYRALKARYNKEAASVAQAYRSAMPRLTSVDFWKHYLGLESGS